MLEGDIRRGYTCLGRTIEPLVELVIELLAGPLIQLLVGLMMIQLLVEREKEGWRLALLPRRHGL